MKSKTYTTKEIKKLFNMQKIATLPEIKSALGTNVDMTVFRKLKELSYKTSYSHGGKYYTLDTIACFNRRGLWSIKSIKFSKFGSLIMTCKTFVEKSEFGYSVNELDKILGVETKEPLLKLFKRNLVARKKQKGVNVYFSIDADFRKKQQLFRHEKESEPNIKSGNFGNDLLLHETKAAIILFYSILDERQRRIFAGLESLKICRGGDQIISELLEVDAHTISKGRKELLNGKFKHGWLRKKGAGRKKIKKKTPIL